MSAGAPGYVFSVFYSSVQDVLTLAKRLHGAVNIMVVETGTSHGRRGSLA